MNKKIIAAAIAGLALTGALAFGTTVSAADERPMVPPEYSQKGDAWTKNNDQYSSQQIQNMKKAEQKDQKEHAKKLIGPRTIRSTAKRKPRRQKELLEWLRKPSLRMKSPIPAAITVSLSSMQKKAALQEATKMP